MSSQAPTYRFKVQGHLSDRWSPWLGELTITHDVDDTSTIAGPVADQAQLHGLLAQLRDIGAPLLSLQTVDPPAVRAVLEEPVHTARLVLRAARPDDAEPTWAYRRLESVGRWLTAVPHDLEAYRATFTDPARLAATVVVELRDGPGDSRGNRLIGDFMLRVEDAWSQAEVVDQARGTQAELGWVLDPAHTGHGYATEAVTALLRVCFETLALRRVVANCFLDNDSSWRLMERVGMRREVHAVRESLHRSGRWLDTVAYALLADEWRRAS